jgi:hypothetical protein
LTFAGLAKLSSSDNPPAALATTAAAAASMQQQAVALLTWLQLLLEPTSVFCWYTLINITAWLLH